MKKLNNHLRKNWLLSLLLLTFYAGKLSAQTIQTPTIIPASPTAQTFMRYGEIPVDYSTGVPSIEIPVFTVEGRQLKVPVSISYHASGIKVNDIASEVGLGWALNAGGLVSRSINGRRDEAKSGVRTFYTARHLLDSLAAVADHWDSASTRLDSIMAFEYFFRDNFPIEDPMSDRYFYKLPGGPSGIFTYDYYSLTDDDSSVILLPYKPFKIKKYVSNSNTTAARIDSIKITDDRGTLYLFIPSLDNPPQDFSEWILKRMVSADGKDTIAFNYVFQENYKSINRRTFIYQDTATLLVTDGCSPDDISYSMATPSVSIPSFATPMLESIVSATAIVRFEYASRQDFDVLKRLTRITISPANTASDTIKTFRFVPRYFGSEDEDKRLGLDSVIISAPGDSQPQVYTFVYESQALPPYPFKMTYQEYKEDYWGYYNGNNSSYDKSLIQREMIAHPLAQQSVYGGNREADPSSNHYYSKACMLKEIKYPTGGKTVFTFDRCYDSGAYYYHDNPNDHGGYIGGFRVSSITNYTDSNTIASQKTYEYPFAVTKSVRKEYYSYDQVYAEKVYQVFDPGLDPVSCWTNSSRNIVLSDPLLPHEVASGMPVMYLAVIEYTGTPAANTGKTVYEYGAPYSAADYYSNPEHPVEFEWEWFYHPFHYDKGNYIPELISKTVYSFDGGSYTPLAKEINEYSKLKVDSFNTGIKLSRPRQYADPTYFIFSACTAGLYYCYWLLGPEIEAYINSVIAIDTRAYQEASLLTNSRSYVFDPFDSTKYVLTNTDYVYNESNLALKETITLSSKADTLRSLIKYPIDFSGTPVYDTMLTRNILSPAIEQLSYRNSDFLQATKTNYDFWNGTAWSSSGNLQTLPRTVATKNFDQGSYETRLRYHVYDTLGNIITVSKENDQQLHYLWDYKQTYPVAQVTNASLDDIAFTSFEADGKGGWDYSGAGIVHPTAPTGARAYRPTTGSGSSSLYRTGLSSGKTYIITFWKRDSAGTIGVSGATGGFTGITRNGWQLHRYELTGYTTLSISGSAFIDEVRLYPSGAQMATYTYKLLVGMTSQTDPNNRITYYEYDKAGRLNLVRDQDHNIVRKICYNYAGQVEDCGTFHNEAFSAYYTPQSCASQTTPLPYLVNVPGGMFSSITSQQDADTQAQAYAQEQADLHGTCQPYVAITFTKSAPNCYSVEFYNTATYETTWFEITGSSGTLGYLPQGNYDILITSSCDSGNSRIFYAACQNTTNSYGYAAFFGLTVNTSCRNIGIQ